MVKILLNLRRRLPRQPACKERMHNAASNDTPFNSKGRNEWLKESEIGMFAGDIMPA